MTAQRAQPASVLIFAPVSRGGIPHYTHHQAQELARRGIAVTLLCRRDHPWAGRPRGYRMLPHLIGEPDGRGALRKLQRAAIHVLIHWQLLWHVLRQRPAIVLLETHTEFLALVWAPPLLVTRWLGTRYLTTIHDPVRAPLAGGALLSRASLGLFYRLVSGALIHADPPAAARIPSRLAIERVEHGLFEHLGPQPPVFDLRARLGIAADAFVVLAFGQVADRKNLHLLVEAVARVAGAVLVIAGAQASASDRPPAFYAGLAEQRGCNARVHVVDRYIRDEEVGAYVAAADALALTYASGFVSQSGIINIAAQWEKPVLASSGPGPLQETLRACAVGLFVQPDDAAAIAHGIERMMREPVATPEGFARLREQASWRANVDGLLRLVERL